MLKRLVFNILFIMKRLVFNVLFVVKKLALGTINGGFNI